MAARKKASARVGAYKKQGGKKGPTGLSSKQRRRVVKKHGSKTGNDLRSWFGL